MLKSIMMSAAMVLAVPAMAQTTNTTGGNADTGAGQTGTTSSDGSMQSDHQASGTATTGQTGTDMGTGTSGSGMDMSSAPAGTGMGTGTGTNMGGSTMGSMGTGMGNTGMGRTTAAAAGNYPPCTRTRTDSCRQPHGR